MEHLHSSILEQLDKPIEDRIDWINTPRWIGHPQANSILTKLNDLYRYPRQSRMPSLMLIGDSNSGKTRIAKQFMKQHPVSENLNGEFIEAPVLYFETPPSPSEPGLYTQILTGLYERVPSASTDAKRARVLKVLKGVGLKVLILDELHNLMAGSSVKQQEFLNVVKFLSNELSISIVGCGTGDLVRAVSIDTQLQNRFTPIAISRWKFDKSYLQLLKSFESLLPLKEPSNLFESFTARRILALTEGTIGEISTLLNTAAIHALRNKQESINQKIIDECGYVAPGDRTAKAANL